MIGNECIVIGWKKKNKTYSCVFKNAAMDKILWEVVAGFVNTAQKWSIAVFYKNVATSLSLQSRFKNAAIGPSYNRVLNAAQSRSIAVVKKQWL